MLSATGLDPDFVLNDWLTSGLNYRCKGPFLNDMPQPLGEHVKLFKEMLAMAGHNPDVCIKDWFLNHRTRNQEKPKNDRFGKVTAKQREMLEKWNKLSDKSCGIGLI